MSHIKTKYRLSFAVILVLLIASPVVIAGYFQIRKIRTSQAAGTIYYVATNEASASDTGNGSSTQPFKTIQKCANVAQAGDTCLIREGTYRETIATPRSGTSANPITFKAVDGETVTISGTEVVGGWTQHSGNIYKTSQMNWDLGVGANQVFLNNTMMTEARWPNLPADKNPSTIRRGDNAIAEGASGNNVSGTYVDAEFPGDTWWVGGKINTLVGVNPDDHWTAATGNITGIEGNNIDFTFTTTGIGSSYKPMIRNPYYLWGKLEALDTAKEWFRASDGTLYFWAPNGANPGTNVEVKKREYAFDLRGGRSFINIEGIKMVASAIRSDPLTNNVTFDGVEFLYSTHYQIIPALYSDNEKPVMNLYGYNNVIKNSLVAYSAGVAIKLQDNTSSTNRMGNNQAINNVIRDSSYNMNSGAGIFASGYQALAQNNTVFNTHLVTSINMNNIKQGKVLHNEVFNGGLQGTDSAGIIPFKTDGQGSDIGYNVVHTMVPGADLNNSIHLASGIYLDGSTNFNVYRNIVWGAPTNALAISRGTGTDIAGNPMTTTGTNRVYNNTFDGEIGGWNNQTNTPTLNVNIEVKNNLYDNYDRSVERSDIVFQNNILSGFTDVRYKDQKNHDYQLNSGSPAINSGQVITPYTNGSDGIPDIGALESGKTPFLAGATLLSKHLNSNLTVTCQKPVNNKTTCKVTNLPIGRKAPADFKVSIGSNLASGSCVSSYFDTQSYLSTVTCTDVNTAELSGNQPIFFQTQGSSPIDSGEQINVDGLNITSVTQNSGPTVGGTNVTITGSGFNSITKHTRPVTISNPGSAQTNGRILVEVDTQSLISSGKLKADCSDLRVFQGTTELDYWIETGCNTTKTMIWTKIPSLPTGTTSLSLLYGNTNWTSKSDLGKVWPQLSSSNNRLWLQANKGLTLENGKVKGWADQTKFGRLATPITDVSDIDSGGTYLANGIGGKPSITFDGSDGLILSAKSSTNSPNDLSVAQNQPRSVIAVFRYPSLKANNNLLGNYGFNPVIELGTTTLTGNVSNRLRVRDNSNEVFSPANSLSMNQNYVASIVGDSNGQEAFVNGNSLIPYSTTKAFQQFFGTNFKIGGNEMTGRHYVGDLAEVLIYGGSLNPTARQEIEQYLNLKYSLFNQNNLPSTALGTEQPSSLSVTFADKICTNLDIISDTQLTCQTPAHPAQIVDVKIKSADNQEFILAQSFTYLDESKSVAITGVSEQNGNYLIAFTPTGYVPTPGSYHTHFYYNTEAQTVVDKMYSGTSPYQLPIASRPANATEICSLVSNPDHTIIPDSGNCFPLPAISSSSQSSSPSSLSSSESSSISSETSSSQNSVSESSTSSIQSSSSLSSSLSSSSSSYTSPWIILIEPDYLFLSTPKAELKEFGTEDLSFGITGDTRIQEGSTCEFAIAAFPDTSKSNPSFGSSILSGSQGTYTNGKCTVTIPKEQQYFAKYQAQIRINNLADGKTYGMDPDILFLYGAIGQVEVSAENESV